MSKKRRNDIATRSAVAKGLVENKVKTVKEETSTPEVLVNGVPYSYEEVLKMDICKAEYVFPFVEKTIYKAVSLDDREYVTVGEISGFQPESIADVLWACVVCKYAEEHNWGKVTFIYDLDREKIFAMADKAPNRGISKEIMDMFLNMALEARRQNKYLMCA